MPTSRNARGVDIVIYSQDGVRKHTIQAKSLSRRNAVPIGTSLDSLFADYLIICRYVLKESPEIFIASINETTKADIHKVKGRDGRISYWIEPRDYEKYKDNWDVIGKGF